jgi:hypothetical protein
VTRIKSLTILSIIVTVVIIGCGNDDDDRIEDIRIGMTALEVIEILGTPLSIIPTDDLGTLYHYDNLNVWIDPDTQKVTTVSLPT